MSTISPTRNRNRAGSNSLDFRVFLASSCTPGFSPDAETPPCALFASPVRLGVFFFNFPLPAFFATGRGNASSMNFHSSANGGSSCERGVLKRSVRACSRAAFRSPGCHVVSANRASRRQRPSESRRHSVGCSVIAPPCFSGRGRMRTSGNKISYF